MSLICLTLLGSCGCARTSVYVLDQKELMRVHKGDKVDAAFDGYVMSDRAIERVLESKIDAKKIS